VWHHRHHPPTLPPPWLPLLQVSKSPVLEYPVLPLHHLRLVFPVLQPDFIYHSSSLPAPPSKSPVSTLPSNSRSSILYSSHPVLLDFHYLTTSPHFLSIHLGTRGVGSLAAAYLARRASGILCMCRRGSLVARGWRPGVVATFSEPY
jgi:hypothetical protein